MNLVSGHPTFIDAVKELLPSEAPMNPFEVRGDQYLGLYDTKERILAEYFNYSDLYLTALEAPDYEIAEVHGEGIYGYVLTIFDGRDIGVAFYASPDV